MKKKIASFIVFILITLITTTIFATITANTKLIASKSKVKPGETFTVKLNISNINAGRDGLISAKLNIDYDKNIFETLTNDNTKGLNGLSAIYNESSAGNILLVSMVSAEGIKSDSDFAEVTFKVKEGAEPKNSTITFRDIEVANLEGANLGSKSVSVEIIDENGENEPTAKPNGGSESTPTPSTKPNDTTTPTANSNQDNGVDKGDRPVTNIDTNTSGGTSKGASSSGGSTIKGPTTSSSSSLPKAGINSTIAVLMFAVTTLGTVAYIKLRKYKEF